MLEVVNRRLPTHGNTKQCSYCVITNSGWMLELISFVESVGYGKYIEKKMHLTNSFYLFRHVRFHSWPGLNTPPFSSP